jgi:non-homologous end joining protein Ku
MHGVESGSDELMPRSIWNGTIKFGLAAVPINRTIST